MSELEASVAAPEIGHAGAGAWFVRGPAGSGKTWLLGEVSQLANERTVYHVRAKAVTTALGASMEPPVDAANIDELRAAVQGAMVLVDDVDRLDEAAIEALLALAADAGRDDLSLVATERLGRGSRATAQLATSCIAVSLTGLDPLRPTFRDLVDANDPDDVDRLLAATGGWYELLAAHPLVAPANAAVALIEPRLGSVSAAARDLATCLAFGGSLTDGSAEQLTGATGAALDDLVAELEGAGVLHAGRLTDLVAAAICQCTPAGRRREALRAVLDIGSASAVARLADWIVETDDRSPVAMEVLVAAAARRPPEPAAELLRIAVDGGAGADAERAMGLALLGAGRATDAVAAVASLSDNDEILRASLARAGRMRDASRIGAGGSPVHAALVAAAVADVDIARALIADAEPAPVGEEATAIALLEASLALVQGGAGAAAAARNARRLSRDGVDMSTWVVDPATCAVIASTEAADADERIDGEPALSVRHLATVVTAWQAMRAGRLQEARGEWPDDLAGLEAGLAAVVDAGLALRADHLDALPGLVGAALEALEGVQVDAWRLPVMMELLPAVARSGVSAGSWRNACDELVAVCGPDSLLVLAMARARLIAAMTADDAEATVGAATALAEIPGHSPAHELWRSVAPVVAAVFADDVDADAVLSAAAALRDKGQVFEAGRLTGAAALRCGEERTAKSLLRESRAMRQERKTSSGGHRGDVTGLSDREVEVARLVLEGRTHKEVGATLFISAKTVEHHVARIRNKLGASGRAEMMAAIRDYLDAIDNIDALG